MAEGHVIAVTGPPMGQAAGTAAEFAAAGGTVPRSVPVDGPRKRLALDWALLEPAAVAAGEEAAR